MGRGAPSMQERLQGAQPLDFHVLGRRAQNEGARGGHDTEAMIGAVM